MRSCSQFPCAGLCNRQKKVLSWEFPEPCSQPKYTDLDRIVLEHSRCTECWVDVTTRTQRTVLTARAQLCDSDAHM